MASLTAFLSFAFLTAFTPGPNNIMALTLAGTYGFRKGFRFCLGVFFGFVGVMSACALFDAALFHLLPAVEPVVKAVGAAYILWLAWTVFRSSGDTSRFLPANSVRAGMTLQFVNPKVILYGITAFSSFVFPWTDSPFAVIFFIGLLSAIGFAGTCCWALCGSAFQRLFNTYRTPLNSLMALLLVWCAVSLFR